VADPVIEWLDNFLEQLEVLADDDGLEVQRKAIVDMIESGEEEIDQLDQTMDAVDDMRMLALLTQMMAHASASQAMFRQALIHFDAKHNQKRSAYLGTWKRHGNQRDN